jgi:N-acetylglucosamine-6-sulfatase
VSGAAKPRRRRWVLLPLATLALASVFQLPAGATRAPARPNIVVIMTDDETAADLRVMPNVLRIFAAGGTAFDHTVVSYPLCCPSRASFLTGRYSHNTGVTGNDLKHGLVNLDESNTLPVWLRAAGYRTLFVGKYLNEYGRLERTKVPPGWDEWWGAVKLSYYNHSLNHNGKIVEYGSTVQDYQTDVYTRLALRAVRENAHTGRPFFLWLSYFAPHYGGPHEEGDPEYLHTPVPAVRHEGRFASEPLPMGPAFNEADVSDKPAAIRKNGQFNPQQIAEMTYLYRQRLETLLAVDEGVQALVKVLKEQKVFKNTLLIFTSDNGYILGEHRVEAGKVLLYEPSIRVPLLMRGPGVPVGVHVQQLVANVDFAPTIAAIAGAKPRLAEDGRSLVPLLENPQRVWRRDVLLERGLDAAGQRVYTAVHTDRYVYAEYDTGERELYDLQTDPDELQSRHDDPAYAQIQAELARRLAKLRDCAGAACRYTPPAFP